MKARAGVPTGSSAYSDANLLAYINEEQTNLFAFTASLNQGFFLTSTDTAIVADQSTYNLPSRSAGFREICYVDASDNESPPLQEIAPIDVWRYAASGGDAPTAYYFEASQIVLIPTPTTTTGYVRFKYKRRPSTLVIDTVSSSQHTTVGIVSSITASLITLTANHNAWPASTTIDISDNSNQHALLRSDIATTTAVAGTATIAVATDMTTGVNTVAAGDYVTLAGKSYVVHLPDEFHSLLELLASARILGMRRKYTAKNECEQAIAGMKKSLMKLYAPRSTGNRKHVNAWRA